MKNKSSIMKKSNNIISEWLDKYGSPDIEKQVEKEIEYINKIEMIKQRIKDFCKEHKLKFERYIDGGFVASSLIDVRDGMERDIRKIGSKRVYRKYICYSDGDIVDNGFVQNYC